MLNQIIIASEAYCFVFKTKRGAVRLPKNEISRRDGKFLESHMSYYRSICY